MARKRLGNMDWKDLVLSSVYGPMMVLQLVLFFFFYQNYLGFDFIVYIGWFLWALSIMFGFLPIYEFRKKGGVAKGRSYIHTTELVDTGVYSIVRHPQYLAGLLIILALMLTTQHWLSAVAGVVAFVAFYIDILIADPRLVEKFGEEYREYMNRVPRVNFVLGIVWRLRRRTRREEEEQRRSPVDRMRGGPTRASPSSSAYGTLGRMPSERKGACGDDPALLWPAST